MIEKKAMTGQTEHCLRQKEIDGPLRVQNNNSWKSSDRFDHDRFSVVWYRHSSACPNDPKIFPMRTERNSSSVGDRQ